MRENGDGNRMDVGEVLAEAGHDSGRRNRGQKGAGPGHAKA